MEMEGAWSFRRAERADRDSVLHLTGERWQESDTLSIEFYHIVADNDKSGYVCTNGNAMTGFIAVYMPTRLTDLVVLHKRIASGGFTGHTILKQLLRFAVQDLTVNRPIEKLYLTVPKDSYALLKNTFLGPCQPLFNRKSLMLTGNMPYVLNKLTSGVIPESNLIFLEGADTLRRLLPFAASSNHMVTVRGDPVYLSDVLYERLPFQTARSLSLLTLTRRPGQIGGLSIGTIKKDSDSMSTNNVLHLDVHTQHWETLQAHVVKHLTLWAQTWTLNCYFYLEINYNADMELYKLLNMTGKLGLVPREETVVKNLASLVGDISDLQLHL